MRAPAASISTSPVEIVLGKNFSIACTSSNTYVSETDNVAVVPQIMWRVTYELNGEVVVDTFEAPNVINLTSNAISSEILYSPILLSMNFTCSSYLSFPSDAVIDSEASEQFLEVIPQGMQCCVQFFYSPLPRYFLSLSLSLSLFPSLLTEPGLNITTAADPQIVADTFPYNKYMITCNTTIPSDLRPLQLSFTISQGLDITSQALNLSTVQDCETVSTYRTCTFAYDGMIQTSILGGSLAFTCSAELFSYAILGAPLDPQFIRLRQESQAVILTVNGTLIFD